MFDQPRSPSLQPPSLGGAKLYVDDPARAHKIKPLHRLSVQDKGPPTNKSPHETLSRGESMFHGVICLWEVPKAP